MKPGTLTVGADGVSGIGFDQLGFSGTFNPYGSLSPTTFELGGVDHSIVELRVGIQSFFIPPSDAGKLFLTFDKALPNGVEFTLTLGTAAFNSSDASVSTATYSWAGGPSWSNADEVAVELALTALAFREGTTLEEVGAFTTPPMPPTLAFEAEMTVGASSFGDGYSNGSYGSISDDTFEVGGVQYTVSDLYYLSGSTSGIWLWFESSLQSSFTLTLDGTELHSKDADIDTNSTRFWWPGAANPSWASGATVDVKLDIGLIDICDRSQVVADAIVAATLSFDFCHMTSQLDMDDITELDLSGKSGYDLSGFHLSGHSWNQLPAGLFDGLDSLEVLDLSDTNLLNLNRGIFGGLGNLIELDLSDTLLQRNSVPVGVFDGLDSLEILRIRNAGYEGGGINLLDDDIFRDLDTLRVLEVRPSKPHLAAPRSLMPPTSLERYNGRDFYRRLHPPHNLTATMATFSGDSSKRTVTLTWDLPPSSVNVALRWQILRTHNGHPLKCTITSGTSSSCDYDYSRFAYEVGNVGLALGSWTFTHGASDGLDPGPNGFAFTYYVVQITNLGLHLSFPAKVFVSD